MSGGIVLDRRRFLGMAADVALLVGAECAFGRAARAADELDTTRAQLRSIVVERALTVDDPWVLMHAVLPLGRAARHGDERVLDLVMRTWMEPVSRGEARYPAFPLGVEAHPNHFLEIMYAVGVPGDHRFPSALGTTTRAELYAGARALFSPAIAGSELSWTLSVFTAQMRPDDDRFTNADGRAFTVSALVEAATQAAEQGYADTFAAMRGEKPYGRSALQQFPCNGTHAVQGVLEAVAHGYEARDLRARVRKLLLASVYRLTAETALIDTHLGGAGTPMAALNADAAKLQIIGHTLGNLAYVVVNRTHRLAGRQEVRMKELSGEPMIVRMSSSTTQEAFDKAAAKAGVQVDPVFTIESREGLREAIIRGLGIGVISETEFAPHPELHAITVTDAKMYTRAYIACLKARRNRPLIRDFLDLAASIFEERAN